MAIQVKTNFLSPLVLCTYIYKKLFYFYSNLILPTSKNTLKRSSTYDIVPNEKYRKMDVNDIVNSEETDNEIVTPIGKKVLDILNTPLVEKTKASPCIKSIPSILKVICNALYLC